MHQKIVFVGDADTRRINSKKAKYAVVAGKVKAKQLKEQNEVKPSNSNDGPKSIRSPESN